jgi:hypothetical protein
MTDMIGNKPRGTATKPPVSVRRCTQCNEPLIEGAECYRAVLGRIEDGHFLNSYSLEPEYHCRDCYER